MSLKISFHQTRVAHEMECISQRDYFGVLPYYMQSNLLFHKAKKTRYATDKIHDKLWQS